MSPRTNNVIAPTDRQASSEVGTGDIGTTNIAIAENRAEIETNVKLLSHPQNSTERDRTESASKTDEEACTLTNLTLQMVQSALTPPQKLTLSQTPSIWLLANMSCETVNDSDPLTDPEQLERKSLGYQLKPEQSLGEDFWL